MSDETKQLGMWGDTDEVAKETSGGSGGIIANTRIAMVYKVYTGSAQDQNETVIEVPTGLSEQDKATRKAKAEELKKRALDNGWVDSKGSPATKVQYGVQMTCKLDGAYSGGKPATWKGDRVFNLDQWVDAYKKTFIPAAVAAGILVIPWEGWLQVGFDADPTGRTELDAQGESRVKLIAVPRKVFASKEEAIEVAQSGGDDAPASSTTCPTGYTETSWNNLKPTIITMLKTEVDKGTAPLDAAKAIASQWQVDEKFILPLVAEIG